MSLMGYAFSTLEAALAISLVDPDRELTTGGVEGRVEEVVEGEEQKKVGGGGNDHSHLVKKSDSGDSTGEMGRGYRRSRRCVSEDMITMGTLVLVSYFMNGISSVCKFTYVAKL